MSRIGHIDDFTPNSSCNIQVDYLNLLVVRTQQQIFLYENKCPHVQDSLDPMGGSVLSDDGLLITCQRHGAEFLSDNGLCVGGPCQGDQLTAVPFTLSNGDIYLD